MAGIFVLGICIYTKQHSKTVVSARYYPLTTPQKAINATVSEVMRPFVPFICPPC